MNAVQSENSPMKFVINGRTFDTATSTVVAISRGIKPPDYNNDVGDHECRYEIVLYRTAKGAFFVHDHSTLKYVKGGRPITEDTVQEMTGDAAVAWIAQFQAMVMNDEGLPLPPEA
jgi:hypothetical protein